MPILVTSEKKSELGTESKVYFTSRMYINTDLICILKGKGKGKVHPRTGHEGPEGE
jgi:hypothetical protein